LSRAPFSVMSGGSGPRRDVVDWGDCE